MNGPTDSGSPGEPMSWRLPLWLGFHIFLAIAVFFLWVEHRSHILGVLPYAVLLVCPLIHISMHRGHNGHDHSHDEHPGMTVESPEKEASKRAKQEIKAEFGKERDDHASRPRGVFLRSGSAEAGRWVGRETPMRDRYLLTASLAFPLFAGQPVLQAIGFLARCCQRRKA